MSTLALVLVWLAAAVAWTGAAVQFRRYRARSRALRQIQEEPRERS